MLVRVEAAALLGMTLVVAGIVLAAKEGLLALAVATDLQVMAAMFDEGVVGCAGRRASTTRAGSATATAARSGWSPWAAGGSR
jgi:hypothetical protein